MSDHQGLDIDEILGVVDAAEVLIIRFQMPVDKRLLVDTRATPLDPPLLRLVDRANSVEERFRGLKQLRPRMPLPDKIMSFQWPRHVRTLEETGIWERIVKRIERSGHATAAGMCAAVWNELLAAERRDEVSAIVGGEGWRTLWEREP